MFFSKFRPSVRIRGRTDGGLLGAVALGGIVLATVLAPVASAAPPGSVFSGDIAADVFTNTGFSSTFVTPVGPPVFRAEGFANLTFNPPNSPPGSSGNSGICSSGGTVTYENNRPMVFVNPQTCHVRILQNGSKTEQAGAVGTGGTDLTAFEVEFTGHIRVNSAGPVTFTAFCDDQCIVGLGHNEDGIQPTDPDGTGITAKKGYNVMFTNPLGTVTSTVTFPAAGSYPIEVDYVENGAGPLTMTLLANGVPLLNQ